MSEFNTVVFYFSFPSRECALSFSEIVKPCGVPVVAFRGDRFLVCTVRYMDLGHSDFLDLTMQLAEWANRRDGTFLGWDRLCREPDSQRQLFTSVEGAPVTTRQGYVD